LLAAFVAEVGDDKSVAAGAKFTPAIRLAGMGWSETQCCRTPHRLRKARFCYRRWAHDKLCEPAGGLRGCRQRELELGTAWPAQAQTTQPGDPLEMCKQQLNPITIAARAIECFGLSQRPGYVTASS